MADAGAVIPPHACQSEAVAYTIVIPTRGRWREARLISTEHSMRKESRPFLLCKTLGFLQRQRICAKNVHLWVSDPQEADRYREALRGDAYWAGTLIRIGVPGIMAQRNHITSQYAHGAYLLSLDDDVSQVMWKRDPHPAPLQPLPDGTLHALICHAHALMLRYNAYIFGLNATSSMNSMSMFRDGVSMRNGEVNGFFYGFINRPALTELLPTVADATEDAERSLRYFQRDSRILRYRMYCARTRCFGYAEGLQALFEGADLAEKQRSRKEAERRAAEELHRRFPQLTLPRKEKKGCSTLEVRFRHIGGLPVPTTTVAVMLAANKADAAAFKNPVPQPSAAAETTRSPKSRSRSRSRTPPRRAQEEEVIEVGDDDEDALEALAENQDLEARVAGAPAVEQEDEEAVFRRVLAESMQDLLVRINGTGAEDPVEVAMRESLLLQGCASQALRGGQPLFEELVDTPPVAAGPTGEAAGQLAQLVEMGFARAEAALALESAGGDLELAAAMLTSGAASDAAAGSGEAGSAEAP